MLEHIVLDYRTVHRRRSNDGWREEQMREGKREINEAARFCSQPYLRGETDNSQAREDCWGVDPATSVNGKSMGAAETVDSTLEHIPPH